MYDLKDVHRLAAIHRLVDDLPQEALDATFRVLEHYAKWPAKAHADAERVLAKARKRFLQQLEDRSVVLEQGSASARVVVARLAPMVRLFIRSRIARPHVRDCSSPFLPWAGICTSLSASDSPRTTKSLYSQSRQLSRMAHRRVMNSRLT